MTTTLKNNRIPVEHARRDNFTMQMPRPEHRDVMVIRRRLRSHPTSAPTVVLVWAALHAPANCKTALQNLTASHVSHVNIITAYIVYSITTLLLCRRRHCL